LPATIAQLQGLIGNQAIQRLLESQNEGAISGYANFSQNQTEGAIPGYANFPQNQTEGAISGYANFPQNQTEGAIPGYANFPQNQTEGAIPGYANFPQNQSSGEHAPGGGAAGYGVPIPAPSPGGAAGYGVPIPASAPGGGAAAAGYGIPIPANVGGVDAERVKKSLEGKQEVQPGEEGEALPPVVEDQLPLEKRLAPGPLLAPRGEPLNLPMELNEGMEPKSAASLGPAEAQALQDKVEKGATPDDWEKAQSLAALAPGQQFETKGLYKGNVATPSGTRFIDYEAEEKNRPHEPGIGPKQTWLDPQVAKQKGIRPDAPTKYITDEEERANYELKFNKEKNIFMWRGKPIDTTKMQRAMSVNQAEANNVIFVMTKSGNIYIADEGAEAEASKDKATGERQWLFNHSSLVQGEEIASAGELYFEGGVLKKVADKSGHYHPTLNYTVQILQLFSKAGVSLQGVKVSVNELPTVMDADVLLREFSAGKSRMEIEAAQHLEDGMKIVRQGGSPDEAHRKLIDAWIKAKDMFTVSVLTEVVQFFTAKNDETLTRLWKSDLEKLQGQSSQPGGPSQPTAYDTVGAPKPAASATEYSTVENTAAKGGDLSLGYFKGEVPDMGSDDEEENAPNANSANDADVSEEEE
jgi:hypothetical protein